MDANGGRFDPNKLLLDPYAKEISHDPLNAMNQNPDIFASGPLYRDIDSGPYAPKGIVLPAMGAMYGKPTFPQSQDIIYEVNVRGLTEQDPNIPAQYRCTYYGSGLDASYLAKLGINTVEFLPIQETQNDENDVISDSTSEQNYWGYMTEDFFAPDRRYAYNKAPGGPTAEFREMVQMFHKAGIKVYMDVVYNHTAEGGMWSSTDPDTATIYSWRGLDDPACYELTTGNQYNYDVTGTGNTLNTYNPVVQNMIVDSLGYWSNTMGVDGFRFDEAPVLGNDCINQSYEVAAPDCPNGGFNFNTGDPNITLNRILRDFNVRPATGGGGPDLIAEPWTASAGDYQGQFPAGWSECNGVFQTTLREAQNKLGIIPVSIGMEANDFASSS